jgi:hypothetical protein
MSAMRQLLTCCLKSCEICGIEMLGEHPDRPKSPHTTGHILESQQLATEDLARPTGRHYGF